MVLRGLIMKFLLKYKKYISDIFLNLISTLVPILVLQFFLLPYVARRTGEVDYGIILTLIGLMSLISTPVGSALNNTRLINDKLYKEKKIVGDYNYILYISTGLSIICIVLGTLYYSDTIDILLILNLILFNILLIFRVYYSVFYRINLNYRAIMVSGLLLTFGYIFGWILFVYTSQWVYIFLFGNLFVMVYILFTTNIYKESFKKTENFSHSLKTFLLLLFSGFLLNFTNYADRLLILPILGAGAVSIYFSANIFTKIIGMTISPISGVILSYLSKKTTISKRYLKIAVIVSFIIAFIGYFVCVFISKPLILYLYSEWSEESIKLIYYTSLSSMLSLISTIISPLVLRFIKKEYQLLINGIYVLAYLAFSVILSISFGLIGFAIGVIISKIIFVFTKIIILFRGKTDLGLKIVND